MTLSLDGNTGNNGGHNLIVYFDKRNVTKTKRSEVNSKKEAESRNRQGAGEERQNRGRGETENGQGISRERAGSKQGTGKELARRCKEWAGNRQDRGRGEGNKRQGAGREWAGNGQGIGWQLVRMGWQANGHLPFMWQPGRQSARLILSRCDLVLFPIHVQVAAGRE